MGWAENVSEIRAAMGDVGFDEHLLKDAGIGTDDGRLIEFLMKRSASDEDLQHLAAVVRALGSASFEEREQASSRLVTVGQAALHTLRTATKDSDPEVVRRARACIEKVERDPQAGLARAAIRVLVWRRTPGVARVLVRYLPFTTDPRVEEEIYYGLYTLALENGTTNRDLLAALHDSLPPRRAVSACIIGSAGTRVQREAVRALLADSNSLVRLRAAQGLLAANDKTAVPALLALLDDSSVTVSWQAEELLHFAAGPTAPKSTVTTRIVEQRKKAQQDWASWWQANGPELDLSRPISGRHRPMLVLACGWGTWQGSPEGRAWLFGGDGQLRWSLKLDQYIADARLLGNGRLLLAERQANTRLGDNEPDGRITERDLTGTLLWQHAIALGQGCPTCRRLSTGRTFVFTGERACAIDPDGQETFLDSGELIDKCTLGLSSAECMDTGHLVAVTRTRPAFIVTVLGDGSPLRRGLMLQRKYSLQYSRLQIVADGNYLLIFPRHSEVVELTPHGALVRRLEVPNLFDATRLRRGNMLITTAGPQCRIYEYTEAGITEWTAHPDRCAMRAHECYPVLSLGFTAPPR